MKLRNNITSEQEKKLVAIRAYKSVFIIPKSESDAAWGRAQVFVSKYSSMKIQTVSDFIIETFNTGAAESADMMNGKYKFAYTITRSPKANDVEFSVESRSSCDDCNGLKDILLDNESFASYYIQTGKDIEIPEFIGR
jgi:hypothetical protein